VTLYLNEISNRFHASAIEFAPYLLYGKSPIPKDHHMSTSTDVPQLLATAEALANDAKADASQIEAMTVETVSAFEARLQHHFARGPFFVKLRNKLKEDGHMDLAQTVYHYYLAANVLKHGGGKSYRELENSPDQPFTLQDEDDKARIDVTTDNFLSTLVAALQDAHQKLETT